MEVRHGRCRLRTVKPEDAELLLRWENDPSVWEVSGTTRHFTPEEIEQFIAEQQAGIEICGQLRLMIENDQDETVGAVDLFEFNPDKREAGVGILIHNPGHRRKGYAFEALVALASYAHTTLRLDRLWCNIFPENEASLSLFRRAGYKKADYIPQADSDWMSGRSILRFQKEL